mmetsp:Transcript_21531/g.71186  ORF Transcript_21531/g.71186 Transcript_21531/m.71186 type:complete len:213 (+) Transcript_21531:374-1012(+)
MLRHQRKAFGPQPGQLEHGHAEQQRGRRKRAEAQQPLERAQLDALQQQLHQHQLRRLGELRRRHRKHARPDELDLALGGDDGAGGDDEHRADHGPRGRLEPREEHEHEHDQRRRRLEHLQEGDRQVDVGEVAKVQRERREHSDRRRPQKVEARRHLDGARHPRRRVRDRGRAREREEHADERERHREAEAQHGDDPLVEHDDARRGGAEHES